MIRLPVTIAEQSAQPLSAFDGTLGWEWRKFRSDDLVSQPPMVSLPVIMENEVRGRPVEAELPDQHHTVQTGFLNGPHKASAGCASGVGGAGEWPRLVAVLIISRERCHPQSLHIL
jgi:hypothetical protein